MRSIPSGRCEKCWPRAGASDDPAEEHERATRIEIALGKAGFSDSDPKTGTLSGGWRKRLAVARELARQPDLVLIDEPTNHLDLEGILWLEELLQDAPFAYLVVSHDRYFLESVTNQVVEFRPGLPRRLLLASMAPTSEFLTRREEFLAGQARQEQSLASKVRREVEWPAACSAQARTGKSSARTKDAHQLIGDHRTIKARNAPTATADLDFAATGRRSAKLVVAENVAKTLGDRPLFAGLSFLLSPGTKLGLLGPNGGGKTTLLRIPGSARFGRTLARSSVPRRSAWSPSIRTAVISTRPPRCAAPLRQTRTPWSSAADRCT